MSDKPLNEGYQPTVGYVKDGFQPIQDKRGYQPTTQPKKNVVPPNTGSHVNPVADKK